MSSEAVWFGGVSSGFVAGIESWMAIEHKNWYKWLVVAVLWVIGCLNYTDRQAIFSVFPILNKELGMSDVQLGLLGSVFLWVYGLSSPVAGYLGDRFRRKKVILWSLVIFSASTFATGMALARWHLLWLRGLLGISEALYLPAALALIADYHSSRTRSTAVGLHQTGLLTGGVLGGFLGGYMGEHYGWRVAFYLLGGVGALVALVSVLSLREAPKGASDFLTSGQVRAVPREPLARTLREILTKPTILCIIFAGIAGSASGWVVMTWMPLYLHERFGMGLAQAGFSASFYFMISGAGGLLVGSLLSDCWAMRDQRGRMFLQVIGFAIAAPAALVVGSIGTAGGLLVLMFLFGFGRGVWDCNNMPIFCDVMTPATRSTTFGVFNLANTLSGGMAVFLTGVLKKSLGIGATISVFGLLLVASAGLTLLVSLRFLPKDMRDLREKLAGYRENREAITP
jgi:MFS transporter, Spinster family, sphingosine-1-phosphate transporter